MSVSITIKQAQDRHPWNTLNGGFGAVPYSPAVMHAGYLGIPHIQGSHAVLHAAKSVGKLAAVFEDLDHRDGGYTGTVGPNDEQLATLKAMSADLLTAALRIAHLYKFDLGRELEKRALEKNGIGISDAT